MQAERTQFPSFRSAIHLVDHAKQNIWNYADYLGSRVYLPFPTRILVDMIV
jgi:hypothetical protein